MSNRKAAPCWLDMAGNQLESRGYDPGQIFEFHYAIPGYQKGGIVGTRTKPGKPPRRIQEVRTVFLKQDRKQGGAVVELSASAIAEYFPSLRFC